MNTSQIEKKEIKLVLFTFLIGMLLSLNAYGQLEIVNSQMVVTTDGAVISGKHFDVQGVQALVINASNVTVKNCLFTNSGWAILIVESNTGVTIKSNRFEMCGTVIRAKGGNHHLTVQYNEVNGVGVLDNTETLDWGGNSHWYWASNFVQVSNGDNLNVSYNIIDNKGLDSKWLEDFINFYGDVNNTVVRANKIRGTSNFCMVSGTGGAVILDCTGSDHLFEDNIVVRASGYGLGTAGGSNVTIQNNYAYYPSDHIESYTMHPHHDEVGGSYCYGNFIYGGRPCGTNNKLLNNHGYSISGGATSTACVSRVYDYTWNVYESCSFVEKSGNVFPASDPGWDSLLPDDMFANLEPEYFSGKAGDFEAPGKPQIVMANAVSTTAISLTWNANTESDFKCYNLKRSDTEDRNYVNIAIDISNNTYIDSSAFPETTYYYVVTALDNVMNESEYSEVVSATTDDLPQTQSYYDFNEVSETGEIDDLGPKGNTGTLMGESIEWSVLGGIVSEHPDENQACIKITGATNSSASYFKVPYADFHNSSSYTYSVWVKWDITADAANSHLFWQNGDDTNAERHVDMWWNIDNNVVASTLHDEDGNEVEVVPESQEGLNMFDGEWHQVAITLRDDTVISIYADGKIIAQKKSVKPIATTGSNDLLVACFPDNIANNSKMLGFIDRVRIYDKALNEIEILYLYNSEEPSEPAPAAPLGVIAIEKEWMIELDWDDNTEDNFDHYNIMRSNTSGGPYELIKTLTTSSHIDLYIEYETTYFYTIVAVNKKGYKSDMSEEVQAASLAVGINESVLESTFALQQNRPNPFNSETLISYELREPGFVELQIMDVTGRIINTIEQLEKQSGSYEVKWRPKSETDGIQFYKLTVSSSNGVFSDIKKMVLIK